MVGYLKNTVTGVQKKSKTLFLGLTTIVLMLNYVPPIYIYFKLEYISCCNISDGKLRIILRIASNISTFVVAIDIASNSAVANFVINQYICTNAVEMY